MTILFKEHLLHTLGFKTYYKFRYIFKRQKGIFNNLLIYLIFMNGHKAMTTIPLYKNIHLVFRCITDNGNIPAFKALKITIEEKTDRYWLHKTKLK